MAADLFAAPAAIGLLDVDRSEFLGGSDAAAVMGLSPWATPVELWQQKTGRAPKPKVTQARQRMFDRGHKLEPFIRDMVIDKLRDQGLDVELLTSNARYTDPEHAFLRCEVDFELLLRGSTVIGSKIVEFKGEHINADAKSVSGFARQKWGDVDTEDVPIEYAAQFMHGLMVTGRRYCLVAALRSFDEVDIFWNVRDDETIAGMRQRLVRFWVDHVQTNRAPDPIDFDDIKALFPTDDGGAVEATKDIAEKVDQLRKTRADIKRLQEIDEALTFELGNYIRPRTWLTVNGRPVMSWKGQRSTRLDIDAFRSAHPDWFAMFADTGVQRVLRFVNRK
jgi:putative phage-type endonuclease